MAITKEDVAKLIKPLEWFELLDGTDSWVAYCLGEEYQIWLEDGKYVFWEEGEGPKYDTFEEAKEAANGYNRDRILREFDFGQD